MTNTVELVIDAGATLAEGPVWDANTRLLYWVDIEGHCVYSYDPQHGTQRSFPVGQYVSAAVLRQSGDLLLAVQHGFANLDPRTGQIQMIAAVEPDKPDNRFNDGKCDPAGRFWAGTMALDGRSGASSLYCLGIDQQVRQMISGVTVSNGLAWSFDQRTMYYIDSATQTVVAYEYDLDSGAITNRQVVIQVPADLGYPDGMTIDAEGMLWVAHWGGACVTRWDPNCGVALQSIPLPATNVTSCCFGGADFADLYITTARQGLSKEELAKQPAAGGIFRVRPGVCGLPSSAYAG
jgi:sugar lactone lactonase YvrE